MSFHDEADESREAQRRRENEVVAEQMLAVARRSGTWAALDCPAHRVECPCCARLRALLEVAHR